MLCPIIWYIDSQGKIELPLDGDSTSRQNDGTNLLDMWHQIPQD
jgi:hypothetical protein